MEVRECDGFMSLFGLRALYYTIVEEPPTDYKQPSVPVNYWKYDVTKVVKALRAYSR